MLASRRSCGSALIAGCLKWPGGGVRWVGMCGKLTALLSTFGSKTREQSGQHALFQRHIWLNVFSLRKWIADLTASESVRPPVEVQERDAEERGHDKGGNILRWHAYQKKNNYPIKKK